MLYHSPPLKEFAHPIPICQPEADLNYVLSMFQHLNCKMLAIPQGRSSWGVITAENLLSSMVKAYWSKEEKLVSQTRTSSDRSKTNPRSSLELDRAIESVMVYQDDVELNKFLNSLEGNLWLEQERICLIINRQGKLRGRLDRRKIIGYLRHQPARSPAKTAKTSLSQILTNWIEKIALPCKIETASGQTVYANQLWLGLIKSSSPVNHSKTMRFSAASVDPMQYRREPHELARDRVLTDNLSWDDTTLQLPEDVSLNDLSNWEESKQLNSWKYWKIPLAVKPKTTRAKQYLILATPITESHKRSKEQISLPPKAIDNRILAAVSHELKSPLTGILGLSSLLKGQELGSLNQRQIRYIELIYRSSKKMMGIVDDLLRLNSLTAEQSQSAELINLELLCRQLCQQILTKLCSTEEHCTLPLEVHWDRLSIELGSEITVANRALLSAILSHLLLEAIESGDLKPPKIAIKSRSGITAISISRHQSLPIVNLGLNWIAAEYLSKLLPSRVTHTCSGDRCQLTLLLPKNQTKPQSSFLAVATASEPRRTSNSNLTILCLYPELDVIDLRAEKIPNPNFDLKSWSNHYEMQAKHQHRIIEADSLEQAHNLARIWQLDAIVLNGYQIALPDLYLRSLQQYEHLARLPLITLDARTTEAANQIEALNVYPCLLSAQQCNIEDLIQVIRIALET